MIYDIKQLLSALEHAQDLNLDKATGEVTNSEMPHSVVKAQVFTPERNVKGETQT